MNRSPGMIAGVTALIAASVSGFSLSELLVRRLHGTPELWISIAITIVAFAVGASSTYLTGLARKLSRKPRVFLSYSHDAMPVATELIQALRSSGAKVWIDEEQLRAGERWDVSILKGMSDADVFLALLSHGRSDNLSFELKTANDKHIKIIPVLLENADVPPELRKLNYIDLTKDTAAGISRVLEAVA